MARAHFVKSARKAIPEAGIKKGDSYYWWKFRFGGKNVSKTPPRASQLTQSAFLGWLYDLQERINDFTSTSIDDVKNFVEELVSEIEGQREECQEKYDNMPDGLRENSSSGQMLEERIQALDDWQNELEGVDTDIDEAEIRVEALDKICDDLENGDDIEEEELIERWEAQEAASFDDLLGEMIAEVVSERLEEVKACEYRGS